MRVRNCIRNQIMADAGTCYGASMQVKIFRRSSHRLAKPEKRGGWELQRICELQDIQETDIPFTTLNPTYVAPVQARSIRKFIL